MPITFVGDGVPTQGHEERSMVPDLPVGLAHGDLLVVGAYAGRPAPDHQGGQQIPWGMSSAGWSAAVNHNPGYGGFLGIWYRIYQGTPVDPEIIPLATIFEQFAVSQIAAWRSVHNLSPLGFAGTPIAQNQEVGTLGPMIGIQAFAGDLVLAVGCKGFAHVTGGATPPVGYGGFTEIYTEGSGIVAYQAQPGPIMAWHYALPAIDTGEIELYTAIVENELLDPPYPGIGVMVSFKPGVAGANVPAASNQYRARGG
jgi:hypothetical protein